MFFVHFLKVLLLALCRHTSWHINLQPCRFCLGEILKQQKLFVSYIDWVIFFLHFFSRDSTFYFLLHKKQHAFGRLPISTVVSPVSAAGGTSSSFGSTTVVCRRSESGDPGSWARSKDHPGETVWKVALLLLFVFWALVTLVLRKDVILKMPLE